MNVVWVIAAGDRLRRRSLTNSQQAFVFCHIADNVVSDKPLLRLAGIHQALFTDSIHHPWNAVRDLVDTIYGGGSKDVLCAACVLHVRIDVVLAFRTVKRRHRAVDIDPLSYRAILMSLLSIIYHASITICTALLPLSPPYQSSPSPSFRQCRRPPHLHCQSTFCLYQQVFPSLSIYPHRSISHGIPAGRLMSL